LIHSFFSPKVFLNLFEFLLLNSFLLLWCSRLFRGLFGISTENCTINFHSSANATLCAINMPPTYLTAWNPPLPIPHLPNQLPSQRPLFLAFPLHVSISGPQISDKAANPHKRVASRIIVESHGIWAKAIEQPWQLEATPKWRFYWTDKAALSLI